MSCLDLSFVSKDIGTRCTWHATKETHGSDHLVISINIKVGKNIEQPFSPEDNDRGITWSFINANWNIYSENLCSVFCQQSVPPTNVQEQYDFFIQNVLDVSNDMFRIKPNESPKCRPAPWWNLECKNVVKERNKAKNKFLKSLMFTDLQNYKEKRALAQKTIRNSKQTYWKKFCEKMNRFTPTGKVCSKIKQMNSNCTNRKDNFPAFVLQDGNRIINGNRDKANELATLYTSFSPNLSDNFKKTKSEIEDNMGNIDFERKYEVMNEPFVLQELINAIAAMKNSTPGPDMICQPMITHLPDCALRFLLDVFNMIWETSNFPKGWTHSLIIPILKRSEDPSNPGSYRPISLTSIMCKLMERMVNSRLIWILEKFNIISHVKMVLEKIEVQWTP